MTEARRLPVPSLFALLEELNVRTARRQLTEFRLAATAAQGTPDGVGDMERALVAAAGVTPASAPPRNDIARFIADMGGAR